MVCTLFARPRKRTISMVLPLRMETNYSSSVWKKTLSTHMFFAFTLLLLFTVGVLTFTQFSPSWMYALLCVLCHWREQAKKQVYKVGRAVSVAFKCRQQQTLCTHLHKLDSKQWGWLCHLLHACYFQPSRCGAHPYCNTFLGGFAITTIQITSIAVLSKTHFIENSSSPPITPPESPPLVLPDSIYTICNHVLHTCC